MESKITRGFITIATGDIKYYELANNLLKSYKLFRDEQIPFAIMCDKENEFTKNFDDIILMSNPTCSYLDKFQILVNSPYDETIFIDADCLAYDDLNKYWLYFENASDVSCFGSSLSLNSKDGWFLYKDVKEYKQKLKYIPQMHGGIFFVRKSIGSKKIYNLCLEIAKNYHEYKFKYFEKPADEPILALSMAVCDFRPVENKPEYYVFMPCVKKINADILKKTLSYIKFSGEKINTCMLIHFQNLNTQKELYKFELDRLNLIIKRKKIQNFSIDEIILYRIKLKYGYYFIKIKIKDLLDRFLRFIEK
ncbi:MAG: hypothetical protein ACRDA0_11405 [Cetobacterium sp.]|uniref:hypothetical protein n=1 Tax=Cetobacterium sp. TaxID=2071632 RepID=UPI003F36A69D